MASLRTEEADPCLLPTLAAVSTLVCPTSWFGTSITRKSPRASISRHDGQHYRGRPRALFTHDYSEGAGGTYAQSRWIRRPLSNKIYSPSTSSRGNLPHSPILRSTTSPCLPNRLPLSQTMTSNHQQKTCLQRTTMNGGVALTSKRTV